MKNYAFILGKTVLAVALTGVFGVVSAQVDTTSEHYYLYTYFYNAEQENGFRIAVSSDGIEWVKINNEEPLFTPNVGVEKIGRDPNMWFDQEKGVFHLIWGIGWNETGIGYATSKDLKTWSDQVYLPVGEKIPNCLCCWGPELFYDDIKDSIMIHWSTEFGQGGKRSFCVMTKDFNSFSDPVKFFDPGYTEIDASIIKYSQDRYYLFFKDEREAFIAGKISKNIHYVAGTTPQGPWSEVSEAITNPGCEGPSPIMVGEELRVYFDPYFDPTSTYRMVTVNGDPSSVTEMPWDEGNTLISGGDPFCPSHGSVIEIPRGYVMSLLYGAPAPLPPIVENENAVIRENSRIRQLTISNRGKVNYYDLMGRNVAAVRDLNGVMSEKQRNVQTAPGVLLLKSTEHYSSQSILSLR